MGVIGDEHALVQAATAAAGEDVLTAGVFGLQDLMFAQMGGGALGALAAGAATAGDPLATGLGALVGGRVAKEEAARRLGLTRQLLLAVTPGHIVLFTWQDGRVRDEVLRFDRTSTSVEVSGFGLSRIVTLREPGGSEITLHGTAAPFRPQSRPDAEVLKALRGG